MYHPGDHRPFSNVDWSGLQCLSAYGITVVEPRQVLAEHKSQDVKVSITGNWKEHDSYLCHRRAAHPTTRQRTCRTHRLSRATSPLKISAGSVVKELSSRDLWGFGDKKQAVQLIKAAYCSKQHGIHYTVPTNTNPACFDFVSLHRAASNWR